MLSVRGMCESCLILFLDFVLYIVEFNIHHIVCLMVLSERHPVLLLLHS